MADKWHTSSLHPKVQFHTSHPDHSASFGCMTLVLKQITEIVQIIGLYLIHEFKSVILLKVIDLYDQP